MRTSACDALAAAALEGQGSEGAQRGERSQTFIIQVLAAGQFQALEGAQPSQRLETLVADLHMDVR